MKCYNYDKLVSKIRNTLRYLAFNKPFNVLSSFTGSEGQVTLKEFIQIPDVYAAGRLDQDSEGLLLLSDDGEFIHRLTDPHFHFPKTYLVQVEGTITPEKIEQLENGVIIKGEWTRRCIVKTMLDLQIPPRSKPVTPHGPVSWLKIELREGRKRQIRHMTAVVHLFTLRILRIVIGPVELGDLQPGQFRELSYAEIAAIKKAKK
jgi:23S rRNA pseudouridine2457 synthase